MDPEMRAAFDELRADLDRRLGAVDRKIDDRTGALDRKIDDLRREMRESEERIRRHFDVAVETLRSDFRVFGEGLSGVGQHVGALDADHSRTRTRVDQLEIRVWALERQPRPPG